MANVSGQGAGALVSDAMASLPGMVRISLAEYSGCLQAALCSFGGPLAVLPAQQAELLREFERSDGCVAEITAAVVPDGPLTRNLSSSSRLFAARAALAALDNVVASGPAVMPSAEVEVAVVGGGITGLVMGSSLVDIAVTTIIMEKQGSVGGVWRWHGECAAHAGSRQGQLVPTISLV